jgi:hypothetical protein
VSEPVVPVFAVPVVCEPLSALDVEPSELVSLVVTLLLVLVCVVPESVPAGDAGSAVTGPGVGGTVVAVSSAAAGRSLTAAVGSSLVAAVPAVAGVAVAVAGVAVAVAGVAVAVAGVAVAVAV